LTQLRIYTALVTFERTDADTPYLPPQAQGACGYMAIAATHEDDVYDVLRSELSEIGLELVGVDEITEASKDHIDDLDDHLAENVEEWKPGKRTVWGTIYIYLAEGEA
jgi:hypothetical protein